MSIELITGKSATAHISANDFRAINRANYGPGRYILKDADNMQVSIYANGTVSILKGSCMWSGMHIRCEDPGILKFTPPTTRAAISVYLHYVKDVETLNESVEWVVSVGGDPSPMVDNVADNTMEAYTLFAFARMQADGTIGDTIYKFKLLDCHEDFDLSTVEQRIEEGIELKSAEVDDKLYAQNKKIAILETADVLYNGNEVITSSSKTVQMSKDYRNYKYLIFTFIGNIDGFGLGDDKAFVIIPTFTANSFGGVNNYYNKIRLSDGDVDIRIDSFYYLDLTVRVTASQKIKLYSIYGVN